METSNIEIKASDSTSNPYIALASMIAAGLTGSTTRSTPASRPRSTRPTTRTKSARGVAFAASRRACARRSASLKADPLFKELMPELMWRAYQEVKLAECNAFEANDEEFEFKAHFDVF